MQSKYQQISNSASQKRQEEQLYSENDFPDGGNPPLKPSQINHSESDHCIEVEEIEGDGIGKPFKANISHLTAAKKGYGMATNNLDAINVTDISVGSGIVKKSKNLDVSQAQMKPGVPLENKKKLKTLSPEKLKRQQILCKDGLTIASAVEEDGITKDMKANWVSKIEYVEPLSLEDITNQCARFKQVGHMYWTDSLQNILISLTDSYVFKKFDIMKFAHIESFERKLDLQKIGLEEINGFVLSNDGATLVIFEERMFSFATIGSIDNLFDQSFDIESLLKSNLITWSSKDYDTYTICDAFFSSGSKQLFLTVMDYYENQYVYKSNQEGEELITAIQDFKKGEETFQFESDTLFSYISDFFEYYTYEYVQKLDRFMGRGLYFMRKTEKDSALQVFNAETCSSVSIQDPNGNEIKIVGKYELWFNSYEDYLCILQNGVLHRYHLQDEYTFKKGHSTKVPQLQNSKEIDEQCKLVKVYDNYLYIHSTNTSEILIWNMAADKQVCKYQGSDVSPHKQLGRIPAFQNTDELDNYINSNPLREYLFYADEVNGMSSGILVNFEHVKRHIATTFKNGKEINDTLISEYESSYTLIDYLPERRLLIVSYNGGGDESITRVIQLDNEVSKCKNIEVKGYCEEFLQRVIIEDKSKEWQREILIIIAIEKIEGEKDNQDESQLKILTVPLENIESASLTVIDYKINSHQNTCFFCHKNLEFVTVDNEEKTFSFSFYKIYQEADSFKVKKMINTYETQELFQNAFYFKRMEPEGFKIIKILGYDNRKLFFNCKEESSQSFYMAEVDDSLNLNEAPTKILEMKKSFSFFILKDHYIVEDLTYFFFLKKSDLTKVDLMLQTICNFHYIQDRTYSDQLYIHDRKTERHRLYKLHLFDDYPTAIPQKLMFRDGMLPKYDEATMMLTYYENFQKREDHLTVGKCRLRTHFDPYLDFETYQNELLKTKSERIDYMKNLHVDQILSYNLINRFSFLFQALEDKAMLDMLFAKLEMTPPAEIPLLIPCKGLKGEEDSLFKQAVDTRQQNTLKKLLQFMIRTDRKGLLYQNEIDLQMYKLLHMNIDLKEYFSSNMAMYQIEDSQYFPSLHHDTSNISVPAQCSSLNEVEMKYFDIVEPHLQPLKEAESNLKGTVVVPQHEIEYTVINLKHTFSCPDKKKLMLEIQEAGWKDIKWLEIPLIQAIIDYKWKKYAKPFFVVQFIKTLIFLASFLADIIVLSPEADMGVETNDYLAGCIVTRTICGIYMLDFIRYEFMELINTDFHEYISKDIWNQFDLLFFAVYVAYIPISFVYDKEDYVVKVLQCCIIIFLAIKLNFFLRIFDQFSFLVQMIIAVFYDVRHFIFYYCIIISAFSIQVSILMRGVEGHEGIGPVKYFVMTLRTSLGDNDISEENSEFKILFWIIWLLIMFVGNIVLMNFIIAVVGESYENCMKTNKAQSFKVRMDMIVERECIMTATELENPDFFPPYIVIRKAIIEGEGGEEEEEVDPAVEMQSREIKQIGQRSLNMHTDMGTMQTKIENLQSDIRGIQGELKAHTQTQRELKDLLMAIKTQMDTQKQQQEEQEKNKDQDENKSEANNNENSNKDDDEE